MRAEDWLLYKYDCAMFCKERLGLDVSEPRIEQFLNSPAPELLLLFSRQVGKTTGAAGKVCQKAIFAPNTLSLIVSATQRQAAILQRRVLAFLRMLNRPESWREIPGRDAEIPEDIEEDAKLVRCSSMSLELSHGSEVVSAPASADTVRGYAPNLIVIDEAAYTPDDVYFALRPMRIRTKAQLIAMSSAGAQEGFFFDAWTKEEEWEKIEIRADECAWVTAEELAKERRRLPEKIYQREYENRFMERTGAALSPEVIADMFSDEIKPLVRAPKWAAGLIDEGVEAL